MKTAEMLGGWLVVVGALNWGLVGLGSLMGSELNLVRMLLGSMPAVESLVYVLVGLSGAWLLMEKLSKGK